MSRLLVQNAHVVTCDDANTVAVLDILVQDGRIAQLGRKISTAGMDRVIDATGLVAMPGLVQAHIHLCQTLFRGQADDMELLTWLEQRIWPMEAALSAEDLRASARLGLAELLLGGTTSILDMGTVHHSDVLFEEAARMGMRYTGGKTIMDAGQGFPAVLRESPERALDESVRLCQMWNGREKGRLRYAFAPRFVLSCSEQVMRGCAQEARALGALLHTHASENAEEVQLVRERFGCTNIEHLHNLGFTGHDVLLAHGVWLSSQEQRILRETKTRIVHCPSSNLKLASGIARLQELMDSGVHLALGADGAPCNNNLDGFQEMRLAALLHKARSGPTAVPAHRALRLATRDGALAMGLQDCGMIAPSFRADFILLDLYKPHVWPAVADLTSRIVYAAKSSDVHTVVVDGQVVVHEGALQTADTRSILDTAQRAAAGVRQRLTLD